MCGGEFISIHKNFPFRQIFRIFLFFKCFSISFGDTLFKTSSSLDAFTFVIALFNALLSSKLRTLSTSGNCLGRVDVLGAGGRVHVRV